MKSIRIVLLLLLSTQLMGQKHEITGGVGFAQYFGDLNIVNNGNNPLSIIRDGINPKNYKMSYSLGYRYNLKNRWSFGANFSHFYLAGYDADNKSNQIYDEAFYRLVRNLNFYTDVNELSFDVRYEPFRNPAIWGNPRWFLSPYAGIGLGVFKFNPKTRYNGDEVELQPLGTEGQNNSYGLMQISLPISVGLKVNAPNRKYSIGIDFTYHYTSTDYLDDVSTIYADPSLFSGSEETVSRTQNLANRNLYGQNHPLYGPITSIGEQRGNSKNNDHFMTGQIKFSYYLGRQNLKQTFCPSL